jgi:AcrR family transcriptional regulator
VAQAASSSDTASGADARHASKLANIDQQVNILILWAGRVRDGPQSYRISESGMTKASGSGDPRRWRRRKEARPGEIVAAAIEVFAAKGFGGAKLEEVARRAGVSKATIFSYFPTKHDLFRAVAQTVLASNLDRLQAAAVDLDMPLNEFVPLLLIQAAAIAESPVAAMIRLVINEARSFPDIVRVWHDEVVAKILAVLTSAVERGQARGEIRVGDPRLLAFSIIGPMVGGVIFREVLRETDAKLPDMRDLAKEHAATILDGLTAKGRS